MIRRATSLAEKIHYYAFNVILMVSLVISPLYYAGVLSVSPAAAKEADAPAGASAAAIEASINNMDNLPPLSMADAVTQVNPARVAASAANSVAAQAATPTPTPPTPHYNYPSVVLEQIKQIPDNPESWAVTLTDIPELLFAEDNVAADFSNRTNQNSAWSCVVVGFGGSVQLTNGLVQASAWIGQRGMFLYLAVSDKQLGCEDTGWVGITMLPTHQLSDGNPNWYGSGYSGTVRSLRVWVQTSASNFDNSATDVFIDAIRLYGTFTPDSGDDGGSPQCGDPCHDANTKDDTQVTVGEPINPLSGNYTYSVEDITADSQGQDLSFRRIYSAQHRAWDDNNLVNLQYPLAYGWTHNYNMRLSLDSYGGYFLDGNGAAHRFNCDTGLCIEPNPTYTFAKGFIAKLTRSTNGQNPDVYDLTLFNQAHYTFEEFNSTSFNTAFIATVTSIQEAPGLPIKTFTYDPTYHYLTKVEVGNRSLRFTYTSTFPVGKAPIHLLNNVCYYGASSIQCAQYQYNPPQTGTFGDLVYSRRLTGVVDVRNQQWRYTYETHSAQTPFARLTKVEACSQTALPCNGVIMEQQDFTTFDTGQNQVLQQKNGLNNVTSSFWHMDSRTTQVMDGRGNAFTYYYDNSGSLDLVTYLDYSNAQSGILSDTQFSGPQFRPELKFDGNGNPTLMQWSANGEVLNQVTDANGKITHIEYIKDSLGHELDIVHRITDPMGHVTCYEYNSNLNYPFPTLPIAVVYDNPSVNANATDKTCPNVSGHLNQRTEFTYNESGNGTGFVSDVKNANNVITHFTYDSDGHRSAMIVNYKTGSTPPPEANLTTRYVYDALGRQILVQNPLGRCDVTLYDSAGNVTRTIQNATSSTVCKPLGTAFDTPENIAAAAATVTHDATKPTENITVDMAYDFAGRLVNVTELKNAVLLSLPIQRTTHYEYNGANQMTCQIRSYTGSLTVTNACISTNLATLNASGADKNIYTLSAYDGNGNLITTTDVHGKKDWTCYDVLNRPSRVIKNAQGANPCSPSYIPSTESDKDVTTTLQYDNNGNVTQTKNPDGTLTVLQYDRLNRLIAKSDNYQNGIHQFGSEAADIDIVTLNFYDAVGNIVKTVDPARHLTMMCYDALNRKVRTVVNMGYSDTPAPFTPRTDPCVSGFTRSSASTDTDKELITDFSYDILNQLTQTVDPLGTQGRTTQYQYDAAGRVTRQITNVVVTVTDPTSQNVIRDIAYDAGGQITQITDAVGSAQQRVTCMAYDALGRQVETKRNCTTPIPVPTLDGCTTGAPSDIDVKSWVTYDSFGRLQTQKDPNCNETKFDYDALDRITKFTDPLTHAVLTAYNREGTVYSITNPPTTGAHVTLFSYDGLYRQTQTQTPLNLITKNAYDRMGRLITQTDANNNQKRFWYDGIGRMTQELEGFRFGTLPNDPNAPDTNVQTSYSYDVMSNLLQINLPNSTVITQGFDNLNQRVSLDGPLLGTVDRWGAVYDKGGRQTQVLTPTSSNQTLSYDALDRLTAINYSDSGTADTSFTYDILGRRLQMTDTNSAGSKITQYGYDRMDRVTSVNDPLSQTVGYSYDAGGRRAGITLPGSKSVGYTYDNANRLQTVNDWDAATPDVTYNYDADNQLTGMNLPNGVVVSFSYDSDNRLTQVKYQKGTQTLMQYAYTLDNVGNRTRVDETIQSVLFLGPDLVSPTLDLQTTDTTPTFTWNAVSGANGPYTYEIQVDDSVDFDSALEFTASGTATTQTPTTALPDANYHWRVRAIDNLGTKSQWSDVWTVRVDTVAPLSPNLISPYIGEQIKNFQPTFTWSDWYGIHDAVEYHIQIADNSLFTNSIIDTYVTSPTFTAPPSILTTQKTYYWRVFSKDAAGNWSTYNNWRNFNLNLQIDPVDGLATTDTTPTFKWATVTGATQYQIQVATDPNFSDIRTTWTGLPTPSGGVDSYTLPTALSSPVFTYYWRVNVNLGSGLILSQLPWQFTLEPVPTTPALTAPATASQIQYTGNTTFSWTASVWKDMPYFDYQLQIDNNSNFASPEYDHEYDRMTSVNPSASLSEGTYYWRVRAYPLYMQNEDVKSAWSTARTFVIDQTPPAATNLNLPTNYQVLNTVRPTFSWSAVSGITKYTLHYGDLCCQDNSIDRTTTSYPSTTSVQPGRYWWYVDTFDAAGNQGQSTQRIFTINILKTPVDSTTMSNQRPTFTWYAATPATGTTQYGLQVSTDPDFINLVVDTQTAALTYTIPTIQSPLAPGKYYWRVNVNLNDGNGFVPSTNRWTLGISPTTPSAPMLSSPTNGALVSALDVQLNWNASTTPGVTYEIQVDIAPDFLAAWSLGPLYDEIVNGTNWTVNLGSVETFYWRVRAIGSNGAPSPWTPIWSFTLDFIPPDAPVLSAPADNLKVTTGRPAFTWGAVTGATEYRLEVDDNPDFGSLAIGQNPTTVSFTSTTADTSLHQGVYYWRVKAKDAAGNWGSFSTVRTFTVNLLSAPVNEVSLTSRVPTFTWFKAATSGVTYRLLLSQDSMFLGVTPITGTFTTATSTVSYVVPAASQLNYGRYYWRVDTDYGLGFVPSAIVYSVNITPTQVPVAPTLVSPATGTAVNTNKPTVTWSYNTSATNAVFYFEVQFDNNSDFSSPESDFLTPISLPAGTVQITGTPANALADGLYSWRVRAFNSYNAPSAWSLVRTLTIDTVAPVKPVLVTPTDSFTSTAVRPAFTWGAVSDATQYVLEVDDTPNFTSTLEVNQPVTAPTVTFTLTTSLKEATYYWRVKAKDAAGNFGDYSDSRILRVNVQTGPADGTVTQNRQPQFTWVAATGFTFRLRVAADRAFTSFLVDVPLTAATVTYTPPAVLPLGRLYWRVDFVSGSTVFASPFSWALTITPPPPAPPGLMSPGNNSIVNSTTPAFTWQASKDDPTPNGTSDTAVARQSLAVRETRTAEADTPLLFSAEIAYEIQVSADADFTNVIFTHIGGDTQEQLNTPLADGQYYWRVRGINSLDVAGEWSEAYTFNVDSSVVPVVSATPTETETLIPTDTVEPTATDTATATETPTAVPTEPATGGNSVANASDDVNESGDDFYSSNPEIWIGTGYTTEASYTGLRFSNLQIPQGATITSAHVEFYTPRDTWISLDVSMAAEAADNSPTFSPDNRPSGRSFTAQRVEHHSNDRWLAENWYSLDDISQVIQEVVDRDGWQSGSSLSVILKGIGTKWGRKYVTSFEGDPAHAPRLVVTYTEPAATTDNNSAVVQPGPLTAGQYQETQAGITYNGAWSDYAGSEASGGSVKYTNDPNATVDFQFEGVGLTLSFTQRADSGQKVVCVDNACQLIDLYSAETHWTQPTTIVGLPYGVHSVQIRNISAAYGDLDALRVFGSQAEVDAAGIIKTATPTTEIVLVPTDIPTETAAFTPVPTAIPATLPFIETFDSGAGWSVSGTWLLDTQAAYSGTGWFADSSARGQVSALVYDGFIDLGSATHPQLSFWQKGQLASSDSISVEILPEGGAGGVPVDVQTGLVSDWAQHSVDLSAYAGQTIRLRVMLTTGETLPEGETSVGYSLDELTIQDVVAEATEVPIPTAEPTSVPTATLEPTPVPTDLPTVTPTDIPTAAPEVTETPTLPPIDGQTGSFIGGGKVVAAPAMQAAAVSRTITYTYDKLYRLTSADYKENNLLAYAYDYKYDLMGNRTQAKEYVDSVGDTVTNYTYTRANQLKDSKVAGQPVRTYNYDYNGNLHQILSGSAPIATYDYDGADRLTQYTNGATGSVSSYVYNGLGDRYRQTVAGTTTDYLLDPIGGLTQVLGEFKPGSNTYYLLGLDVIGQQQGTDWSYFGYDGLGSVRQLTGSTGTVTFNANYDPYGNPLEQFGLGKSNLGFTGEYTDPSGLLYLRARYANLNTGTFLTRDPVQGFAGGGSVRWNPYIYVAGNPVNYTDPSGRILPIVAAIAFGAVVGALVGGIGNLASQLAHNGGNIRCIDKSAFLNATLEAGIQGAIGGVFGGPLEQAATTMIWEMAVHHTPVDQAFVKGMAALAFASAFEVGMGLAGEGLSMLRGSGGVADDVARGLEEGVDTIDDDIVNSLDEADNGLGNGSCPINSFSADTLVATEDGETPIGDLKVGDKVLAYNAATGQTGEYPITAVISHTDEVITDLTIDGESIETTPQHPFYTQERGWVDAGDLQVGEHIRTADWDYGTVESVRNVQQTQPMYNLTVDEAHTFFVGDGQWLVHNSVACPDPLEVNGWKNRDSGPISPQQTEAGIYEFKRGQGLKVGSTAKALRQRLREQWKEFGRDMNNVVYTFLDTSPLETGLSLRQAFDKRETITAIAERIRREQLIEKGFTVFGDISASPEAVKAFWNGAERKLIPNWPDWLEPPAWMLK